MQRADFNDLPRPTRERFVRSLVSDSPVARPICRRVAVSRTAAPWYGLLVLGTLLVVGLASIGFGWAGSPVQPPGLIGGYVGGCAAVVLALSMLIRRSAIRGSLPFAPGVYVFPLDLVDARTRQLVLYPLSTLQAFDVVHHAGSRGYTRSTLRFVFPTTSFTFESRDRERAEAEANAVQSARANIAAVVSGGRTLTELAAVDPFAEARARRFVPTRDHGLLARGRPTWTRHIWVMTVVAGAVFGPLAWFARNAASDERAFARISSTLDERAALDYLRAGGRRSVEVESLVIPRAKFALAQKKATPAERAEALGRLLEHYPKSAIDREVRAALVDAQHAAFLAQRNSASGLHAFIEHWPNAPDAPAARAALSELYERTLADYSKRAELTDKSLMAVVSAVLAFSEYGTPIDVRIRRHQAPSLAGADAYVRKGADAHSEETLPSTVAADRTLQTALVGALERTLRRVFQADVVRLSLGLPLDGPAPIPGTPPLAGDVTAPVVVVDYEIGWPGATYDSQDPRARLIGLVVSFDVAIQVPNEVRVLHFATTVAPPETLPFEYKAADPAFQPMLDGKRLYGAMLVRSFDQLAQRWSAAFVKPSDAATAGH